MSYPIEHDEQHHQFSTVVDGKTAILEYFIDENIFIITHTYVPQALEGRGIASALTKEALLFASSNELKVNPVCSFARTYLQRHPEFQSLKIN